MLRFMSKTVKANQNLFAAFGVPEDAAKNLQIRSTLMIELAKYIKRHELTQSQAAEYFGVSQPYISDLMNGRIDRVSIDKLVTLLDRAGRRVTVRVG
jgi:predicted XRE-type DNA-binding protein